LGRELFLAVLRRSEVFEPEFDHSRAVVKDLEDGPWKTRIAEPQPSKSYLCWHGDEAARAAVYRNRNRLRSGVGKNAMRKSLVGDSIREIHLANRTAQS
jgi:hypothetical protein